MELENWEKASLCVHGGTLIEEKFLGVNSPIYTSSSFKYREAPETYYPRYFNTPNQMVLSKKLSLLERGEDALIVSSGMAAISNSILSLMKSGDHILFINDLYGGTQHYASTAFPQLGFEYTFLDTDDISAIEKATKKNTRIIYCETPSNPLLKITNLSLVAQFAKSRDIITIVDNTFATPINQNPISFGIDIVVHSGTKFLGGHSDLSFGAIVSSKKIIEIITHNALNLGACLNAQSCYLAERSLKTLALRVEKQTNNAKEIAGFLNSHPKVKKVYYPGLDSNPGYEIAKKQMKDFGALLSFEINSSQQSEVELLLDSFKLVTPALSLGGIETLVCSPGKTSHVKISAEERKKMGISDGLLRLSAGIEDIKDLMEDLDQGLSRIG